MPDGPMFITNFPDVVFSQYFFKALCSTVLPCYGKVRQKFEKVLLRAIYFRALVPQMGLIMPTIGVYTVEFLMLIKFSRVKACSNFLATLTSEVLPNPVGLRLKQTILEVEV